MAHAAGGAALQPAVIQHNFDYLQPNAAEFESSETWWNVAWWFVLVGYTLLAVGGMLAVGLTTPANLPIVTLAVYFSLPHAATAAQSCVTEARKYHQLAEIEYGVAEELEALPQGPGNIVDPRIDRAVPQALRQVAARYLFWKEESARLMADANAAVAQVAAQNIPQGVEHIFRMQHRRQAFHLHEQALRARVEAANFHSTLRRPQRVHHKLRHLIRFESSPEDRSDVGRLAARALAARYPVPNEPGDPFMTFLGNHRTYSFDEVEQMNENALSDLFHHPHILVIPPEELYARRLPR